MKISVILPGVDGSGGTKVLYEYGKRLEKRGHEVNFYAPIFFYDLHRKNKVKNFLRRFDVLRMNLGFLFFHGIEKINQKYHIHTHIVSRISNSTIPDGDIVIASAWCTTRDVLRLSSSKGKKFYFIQGFEVWDNRALGLESYRVPLKKIVIAQWIKDVIEAEGISMQNVPVIHNGIDTHVYHNADKDYDKKPTKCLMLAHNLPKKGIQYGIQAFEKAREFDPEITLTMFGLKHYEDIPDYVDYHVNPTINEIVQLYCSSDIFIFPSLEEGWGLTPIEAMACGCAVVGTDVGCMIDIGQDGVNYLMSKPKDVDKMSQNIIKLIEDKNLRKNISQNGIKTAQTLDWEISTNQLEHVLEGSLK